MHYREIILDKNRQKMLLSSRMADPLNPSHGATLPPAPVPPLGGSDHSLRTVAALERIALALEHLAFPGLRTPLLASKDESRVDYVDDRLQLEREFAQAQYWAKTGRKLEPWEMPPRPVDENGNEWIDSDRETIKKGT